MDLHIHYKVMWCGVGVFVGRVPNTVLEPGWLGGSGPMGCGCGGWI